MMVQWPMALSTASVLTSSTAYILLIQASKGDDGKFHYSFILVLLLTAVVKAIASALLLTVHNFRFPSARPRFELKTFMYFTASAALYCVNDAFVFIVMSFFDSVSYTILVTGKLAFVAVLTRFVLKRHLTHIQLMAIVILACGIVTNQYEFCSTEDGAPLKGYLIVCIAEVIGAIAGITNEFLMKRTETAVSGAPVHFYNLNLYIASILILTPTLFIWHQEAKEPGDLAAGVDSLVGIMILVNAVRGISVSMIYKYSTNMTKVFIITVSMLITGIVSWKLFDYNLGVQFFLSAIIVGSALYLYSSQKSVDVGEQQSRRLYANVSDVPEFDHELSVINDSTSPVTVTVDDLDD